MPIDCRREHATPFPSPKGKVKLIPCNTRLSELEGMDAEPRPLSRPGFRRAVKRWKENWAFRIQER